MRIFTVTLLICLSVLTGCATVDPALKANYAKAEQLVAQLTPEYPSVKRVSFLVNTVPGLALANKHLNTCTITFDRAYLSSVRTEVELAFTIAHELAHCENGDVDHIVVINHYEGHALQRELAADRRAHQVIKKLQLGDVTELTGEQRPLYLRDSVRASATHPAGSTRYLALLQGKRQAQ